jgi:hypothetical protein
MMTLPRLLDERGMMRRNAAPYLRVPPAYARPWHGRAECGDALRIGLAWAGNPFHKRDRVRSIPLAECAPWSELFGIAWTSLQIGPAANDAVGAAIQLARFDTRIRDLADTAALIAQLGVVIAVDTAVAHLAAALGKPVWLLLPQRPDWRWPWAGGDALVSVDAHFPCARRLVGGRRGRRHGKPATMDACAETNFCR